MGRDRREVGEAELGDWARQAACAGQTELFYSHDGEEPHEGAARAEEAKAICAGCPVIQRCRDDCDAFERSSIHTSNIFGVWGGESPRERIRRRRAERTRRSPAA